MLRSSIATSVVALCVCLLSVAAGAETDEEVELNVEHSLSTSADGKRMFTSRGKIFYRDPKTMVSDGTRKVPLTAAKSRLAGQDMTAFKALAQEGGNYIVKVQSPSGATVTAFAPACAIAASNFKEEWEVTMDQFGSLIALNYVPRTSDCGAMNLDQVKDAVQFDTIIKVAYPWRGIRPELKAGMPPAGGAGPGGQQAAPAQGKEGDGEKPPEEEKSFLQKYWMYLAIPFVFMMMNGMPPEEGKEGPSPGAPRAPPRRRPAN